MDYNALHGTVTEEIKRGTGLAGIHAGQSLRAIAELSKPSLRFAYKMKVRLELSERPADVVPERGKPAPPSGKVRTPEFWRECSGRWTRIAARQSSPWAGSGVLPKPPFTLPYMKNPGIVNRF